MAEPQKVYLDNVLIGEFVGADDPFENLTRLRKFLSENVGPAEPNVAIACMNQAVAFARTAQLLRARPYEQSMMFPLIVNLGFAIELYLKALCATAATSPKGHALDKLLDQVPPLALKVIEGVIPNIRVTDCELHDLAGLRHALRMMRNVYVEWRYAFERGTSGSFHLPWMIWSQMVLHQACVEILSPIVKARRQGPPA